MRTGGWQIGKGFVIPDRNKIDGSLLDLNFNQTKEHNKIAILKDADLFGLAWLGDGATIKIMPLINTLVMCANTPPTVVAIHDCTDHMAAGGKKNAPYIAKLFETQVEEIDPSKTKTDIFYFNGASNVQKAGEVLCAYNPRAYVLHGGEHVTSLFFDDIAKIPEVKVCFWNCLLLSQLENSPSIFSPRR